MKYTVLYAESVESDIEAHIAYFKEQCVADAVIESWFNKLFDQIDSLCEWPRRYSVVEAESMARGFEIRRLIFGNYLILYRIDDGRQIVEVFGFRHGARNPSQTPDTAA